MRGSQLFADDNGLYDSFHPDQASADVGLPAKYVAKSRAGKIGCQEIKTWMSSNKLKLNDEKTEAILCVSKTQREKICVDDACVGDSNNLTCFSS